MSKETVIRLLPHPKRPKRKIRVSFSVHVYRSARWVVSGPNYLFGYDELADALRDAWVMATEAGVGIAIHLEK